MTPAEFEQRYRGLLSEHERATNNVGCLACEGCTRCSESTFLRDCKGVARSNYCTSCVDCTECSHCTSCSTCHGCSHCDRSERCISSAYLVRCVGLTRCTYCFGCVGLSSKDFHILNEPYDREAYFRMLASLGQAVRA